MAENIFVDQNGNRIQPTSQKLTPLANTRVSPADVFTGIDNSNGMLTPSTPDTIGDTMVPADIAPVAPRPDPTPLANAVETIKNAAPLQRVAQRIAPNRAKGTGIRGALADFRPLQKLRNRNP